jgi:hypothetical protein
VRTFVLRTAGQLDRLVRFLKTDIRGVIDAGDAIEVVVQAAHGSPTAAQYRFYFGVLLRCISQQVVVAGRRFPTEAWHEKFKRDFIGYEELPDGGMVGLSTQGLGVEGMASYMRRVEVYGAERGVHFAEEEG